MIGLKKRIINSKRNVFPCFKEGDESNGKADKKSLAAADKIGSGGILNGSDAGAGFAIVAGEVRNLAARAAEAAKKHSETDRKNSC